MPDISTDIMLRVKLVGAIAFGLTLITGTVGAVSAVYKVRDGLVAQVSQQQEQTLKNYPTRQELWQAINKVSRNEDQHYNDLKDRITATQDKVDGIVIYLRKKL